MQPKMSQRGTLAAGLAAEVPVADRDGNRMLEAAVLAELSALTALASTSRFAAGFKTSLSCHVPCTGLEAEAQLEAEAAAEDAEDDDDEEDDDE